MPRITAPTADTADPEQQALLSATRKQLGMVPNLYATMAASSHTLRGYLDMRDALSRGALTPRVREQLALLIAHENACEYCVAAHVKRASRMGLDDAELRDVQEARSDDPHTAAVLNVARYVLRERGRVDDAVLTRARDRGVTDAELTEIVGHVALNVLANYFNHVAQPDLDFPMPHDDQLVK
jgi:uncharacterized peroxidase-related enzyme